MRNKVDLKVVGSIAKRITRVVAPFTVMGLVASKSTKDKKVTTYNDAVSAILRSTMLEVDKTRTIAGLKPEQSSEIYEAVISVIKSSMHSDSKRKTILDITKQAEESK